MTEKQMRKMNMMAEVSSLYYEHDWSQQQIADKLFISRSGVSRILKQAREKHVVEIKINYTFDRCYELENMLCKTFGLKEAYVFNDNGKSEEHTMNGLGQCGAQCLEKYIKDDTVLGVTWGKTLDITIKNLTPKAKKNISIVQLMGVPSKNNSYLDARRIVSELAQNYNGIEYYLNSPLYIEDDYTRKTLANDYSNSKTLEFSEKMDVVITGIGGMNYENFSRLYKGYVDKDTYEEVVDNGAVGTICAHIYDKQGDFSKFPLNNKIVGSDINHITNTRTVIAVAGGEGKNEAIFSAVKANLVNVLVTDYNNAKQILLAQV